jgi:hypothetical protein
MACEVLEALPVAGRILRDEIIGLRTAGASADYPDLMRRITARWWKSTGANRRWCF